jgi:hypothetical protein
MQWLSAQGSSLDNATRPGLHGDVTARAQLSGPSSIRAQLRPARTWSAARFQAAPRGGPSRAQAATPADDGGAWQEGGPSVDAPAGGPWRALPETLPWQALRSAAGRAHQAALLPMQARQRGAARPAGSVFGCVPEHERCACDAAAGARTERRAPPGAGLARGALSHEQGRSRSGCCAGACLCLEVQRVW